MTSNAMYCETVNDTRSITTIYNVIWDQQLKENTSLPRNDKRRCKFSIVFDTVNRTSSNISPPVSITFGKAAYDLAVLLFDY